MSQTSGGVDPTIVKFRDNLRVNLRRQRERRLDQTVFVLGNQFGFPIEALNLPCAEGERDDRDQGYTYVD
jgi:hypothetical protein